MVPSTTRAKNSRNSLEGHAPLWPLDPGADIVTTLPLVLRVVKAKAAKPRVGNRKWICDVAVTR
jgi:hypothetical protein